MPALLAPPITDATRRRLEALAPVVTYPTADPVWRSVPAIAAGRVAYVNIQRAGGNTGVAGIRLALDDLAGQRTGGGS